MSSPKTTLFEIRIGAPIRHESERSTLRKIEQLLSDQERNAIVFANFEVGECQIDLLVALDDFALVIEAKGYSRPVRGGENGNWQVRLASGHWKDFRNPYLQALNAALAVKNAAGRDNEAPYISAAVVFSPGIPPESEAFSGNRKVSVIGEESLGEELDKRTQSAWSVDQWREFANVLGLKPASSVCAACDAGLAEAEDRIRHYGRTFYRTYGNGAALVPFACESTGATVSSFDVVHDVVKEGEGALFHGPTGCGKTMLAITSGVEFNDIGGVTIIVQGKNFSGSARDVLQSEATLLGMPSAIQLLNDARQLNRPILLIVDGYNECQEALRGRLTRVIAGFAYGYEAEILVTSQLALERGHLLELRAFKVRAPTLGTKFAIANQASNGNVNSQEVELLLSAVSSGLEARLIGEVWAKVPPGSSRYALFDSFARIRLGKVASDGIRALSKLAAWLSERLTFSLSIREFDRVMDRASVPSNLQRLLIERGLLTLRGDRVSFPHELFLNAFAAEAVIRRAAGSAEAILEVLSAPLHASRKDLILGAIGDDRMLERLLPKLDDHQSIRFCLEGRCGKQAQEWAEECCRQLWIRLREEAHNVQFRLDREIAGRVEFKESSLSQWSLCDRAFFVVFPVMIADGRNLKEALEIVGIVDQRITGETDRLCRETKIGRRKLQSDLFEMSYVHPQRTSGALGISTICVDLNSGVWRVHNDLLGCSEKKEGVKIPREIMESNLSHGQIYLLLTISRGDGIPASFISRMIETHWKRAPYHLCQSIMNAAAIHCNVENDAEREKLIQKIEGVLDGCNPWIATIVMEALQNLGAFEENAREHKSVVRERIRNCLARSTGSESQKDAWTIYFAQFDHPFSEAYCEVIASLSDGEKKTLLVMASKGVSEAELFVDSLILEISSFGDRGVEESVKRWTKPPPTENRVMTQNDISTFVTAHIALARLGCPLPVHAMSDVPQSMRALVACGAILYWSNRIDMEDKEKRDACVSEFAILTNDGKDAALDVLRECEGVLREGLELLPGDEPVVHSIVDRFPDQAVAISREALGNPLSQVAYFRQQSHFDRERIIAFGIAVLGMYGNSSDRMLLRQYASGKEHGEQAVAALRAIEMRN